MSSHKDYGSAGEKQACLFLESRGCKVLRTNYRTRFGEVDIIAWHDHTLCFVEVKSRQGARQGHPYESVTKAKQRSIVRAALSFLCEEGLGEVQLRFDVIALQGEHFDDIQWLPNAFEAQEG